MDLRRAVGILWWGTLAASLVLGVRIVGQAAMVFAPAGAPSEASLLALLPLALAALAFANLALFAHRWLEQAGTGVAGACALDRAGLLLVLTALVFPLSRVLIAMIATLPNGLGRAIVTGLGGPSLLVLTVGLIFGLLLRMAAVLIRKAAALEVENQAFV